VSYCYTQDFADWVANLGSDVRREHFATSLDKCGIYMASDSTCCYLRSANVAPALAVGIPPARAKDVSLFGIAQVSGGRCALTHCLSDLTTPR